MSKLKAGFARVDVTPFLGMAVAGYYVKRTARGVHDPLLATAVAFDNGENTAVIVTIDLIGLPNSTKVAREIEDCCSLPEGSVFLHCIHTHTGARAFIKQGERDAYHVTYSKENGDLSFKTEEDLVDLFNRYLVQRLKEAVIMSLDDLTPVTGMYSANDGIVKDTTYVRRIRYKDGHVTTWGKFGDPEMVGYANPADESLRLVKIARENADEILIVNFQLHADCMGGEYYSADYVCALRDTVEQTVPNSRCAFFCGAEGELGANNFLADKPPVKNYARAERIGKTIAAEAIRVYKDLKPLSGEKIGFKSKTIDLPTKRDPSQVPESLRLKELYESGQNEKIGDRATVNRIMANAYAILYLEDNKLDFMPITVYGLRVGDLAFMGLPCEPFCTMGIKIRENSKFATTCVTCLTNGGIGYIAMAKDYEEGGYEPANSKLKSGAAELIIEAAGEVLDDLYKE